jgi:hypothetical protein
MEPRAVSDAASLVYQGYDDPWLWVVYDVYGWYVRVRMQLGTPWDGPEEVSVYPNLSDEGIDQAIDSAVNTGGITTEVLRAIPLAHARRQLRRLRLETKGFGEGESPVRERLNSPVDWAEFAKTYADAVAAGHQNPLRHLSDISGIARNTLSARVRRTREMGFLTRPAKGSLGALTPEAQRVLDEAKASDG